MRIILASGSPRRRELLESVGLKFDVVVSHIEERRRPEESVDDYVSRLSREKAAEVAAGNPDAWIIAADTVVFIDGNILEKPLDPADAVKMLGTIAGREHVVYTGLTLRRLSSGHLDSRLIKTKVRLIKLSRQEIEWYVGTGEPLDKAGAYAVQGVGGMFIESIDGNYTNVVGLPLSTLLEMMRAAGLNLTMADPPLRVAK